MSYSQLQVLSRFLRGWIDALGNACKLVIGKSLFVDPRETGSDAFPGPACRLDSTECISYRVPKSLSSGSRVQGAHIHLARDLSQLLVCRFLLLESLLKQLSDFGLLEILCV